jgi:predicted  nucleic acid-binding Zn-ribbon protein
MIDKRGIDSTDDILRENLSNATKKVINSRERIERLKNTIENTLNRDEINHLKYDIQESEERLNIFLKELKEADKIYGAFNEYIKRKKP